jgi:hypothetical protein
MVGSMEEINAAPPAFHFEFTIDRTTWLRGEGCFESRLLTHDGKLCCLGFYCLARGFTRKQIFDEAMPMALVGDNGSQNLRIKLAELGEPTALLLKTAFPDLFDAVDHNHRSLTRLAETNDDYLLSDEERERRLTGMFAARKIKVNFIN